MEFLFWSSLFLIAAAYLGYPILTVLISIFVRNPVKKDAVQPSVSIVIAAFNEEKNIEKKILNTFESDYPHNKLEIIVASDGSTDRTDAIVKGYERNDYGTNVILHRVEGRLGKTAVQNSAVKIASGDIIVFSDAASMYDAKAISMLVRNYADPKVGAVSGLYKYINKRKSSIGAATILFWNYENLIKSRQTKIRTITGCCGCIYSVRKSLYTELPSTIISDLVEPLTIIRKGFRIVFEPDAIAYEETTERPEQEFHMRVRVILRGMNGLLYMKSLLNPFKYPFVSFQLYAHKVLRWMVPIFCLFAFVSNFTLIHKSPTYLYTMFLQVTFYFIAIAGMVFEKKGIRVKPLQLPMYFLIINAASFVSLLKVLRGKNIVVWQTQR